SEPFFTSISSVTCTHSPLLRLVLQMTTTTRYDAANTHSGQNPPPLRSTRVLPLWPAFSVQPDVGSGPPSVREDNTAVGLAAPHTTAWCRGSRIPVQPLNNAASERLSLSLGARHSAVEFHNSRPFVKERLPVLRRPAVAAGSQHSYDLCFVLRQYLQDGGGWRRGCLQHQVVTVDFEVDTDSASRLQSFGRAHIRSLQVTVFSTDGAEGGEGVKGGDLTSTTRHAVRPSASAC